MKRTIINSLGKSFETKKIDTTSTSEQRFSWIHNFKKIDNMKIKSEYNVHKKNAIKSEAAKKSFQYYKKFDLKLAKLTNKSIHSIESMLISKGILTIKPSEQEPIKSISVKEVKSKIDEYYKDTEERKAKARKIAKEITRIKLEIGALKKSDESIEKKESLRVEFSDFEGKFETLYNEKLELSKKLSLYIKELDLSLLETKELDIEGIKLKEEKIKAFKKSKKEEISSKVEADYNKFKELQNLTLLDKFLFWNKLDLRRAHAANELAKTYKENKDLTYDLQLAHLQSEIYSKEGMEFANKKLSCAKEMDKLLSGVPEKDEKYKKQLAEFKAKQKEINVESKQKWATIKTELKSGSASKNATSVKRKEFRNHKSVAKRALKLSMVERFKYINELTKVRNKFKNELKYDKKILDSHVKDNIMNTPIEISEKKYWTSIILGSIFPGLNSLLNKQWVKGIIQSIATIFIIILIAWSFGAFPSSSGNGIVGLGSLGSDPATATNIAIGVTNGVDNDGRFFLVMGVVGIIFLALAIMYWIISILNNINQNNLARAGVRYSNWKDQRKLLQTSGLPYLLSIPAIIFILFIVVLPLISTMLISFTNINQRTWDKDAQRHIVANGVTTPFEWVGFKQYSDIFKVMGPEFKDVFIWTIIWTFGSSITLIALGTFMALLVNQNRVRGKTFFRIIYLLPWAIPAFITIMFFSIFFQHDGIFNKVVGNKIFTPDTDWAVAGGKTKVLMIMMQGWLGHSYIFLLITGMLQSIPKSLYEAARIDGASNTRQFTTITAPIIFAQIAPLIIGQFTFNFNNFGLIYLFNKGGNPDVGKTAGPQDIFISWIYKLINSDANPKPGAAAAMSLIISIFTVTPAAAMFVRSKSFRKADF